MRLEKITLPAILLSMMILTGCSLPRVTALGESTQSGKEVPQKSASLSLTELSSHPLFHYFSLVHGSPELVTGIAGDCNGDGVEDLTLVFRHSEVGNHLVTVYSTGEEYLLSEEISAPVEDCLLVWRDIDEMPPVELLVSGRKGIHIGYAIYRFEGGAWVALFGDGMGDCC